MLREVRLDGLLAQEQLARDLAGSSCARSPARPPRARAVRATSTPVPGRRRTARAARPRAPSRRSRRAGLAAVAQRAVRVESRSARPRAARPRGRGRPPRPVPPPGDVPARGRLRRARRASAPAAAERERQLAGGVPRQPGERLARARRCATAWPAGICIQAARASASRSAPAAAWSRSPRIELDARQRILVARCARPAGSEAAPSPPAGRHQIARRRASRVTELAQRDRETRASVASRCPLSTAATQRDAPPPPPRRTRSRSPAEHRDLCSRGEHPARHAGRRAASAAGLERVLRRPRRPPTARPATRGCSALAR